MFRSLTALSFVLNIVLVAGKGCFFPNGALAPADRACNPDAEDSFCCFTGQGCLSNGLCLVNPHVMDDTEFVYARGTCTDPTWDSHLCPNFVSLTSKITHSA